MKVRHVTVLRMPVTEQSCIKAGFSIMAKTTSRQFKKKKNWHQNDCCEYDMTDFPLMKRNAGCE